MAALESGLYQAESQIETSPGYFWIDNKMIQDPINLNTITLAEAIQKSSQVAIAKVALGYPPMQFLMCFNAVGLASTLAQVYPVRWQACLVMSAPNPGFLGRQWRTAMGLP